MWMIELAFLTGSLHWRLRDCLVGSLQESLAWRLSECLHVCSIRSFVVICVAAACITSHIDKVDHQNRWLEIIPPTTVMRKMLNCISAF